MQRHSKYNVNFAYSQDSLYALQMTIFDTEMKKN